MAFAGRNHVVTHGMRMAHAERFECFQIPQVSIIVLNGKGDGPVSRRHFWACLRQCATGSPTVAPSRLCEILLEGDSLKDA